LSVGESSAAVEQSRAGSEEVLVKVKTHRKHGSFGRQLYSVFMTTWCVGSADGASPGVGSSSVLGKHVGNHIPWIFLEIDIPYLQSALMVEPATSFSMREVD
jgi:hypothetical protein